MTYEEAIALKTYSRYCNCGGYRGTDFNNRDPRHPHMTWCAQYREYEEQQEAFERGPVHRTPASSARTRKPLSRDEQKLIGLLTDLGVLKK